MGSLSTAGALDQRLALDVQGVDALRRTARAAPEEGLRQVSRQFESVFMQMVLKSMREAMIPEGGLFGSQQEKLYASMLDQQLAQGLSGRGVGLAQAMHAQLSRFTPPASAEGAPDPQSGVPSDAVTAFVPRRVLPAPSIASPAAAPPPEAAGAGAPVRPLREESARSDALPAHVQQFVDRMKAPAEAASRATGVPAHLIVAQAALESGWGRREIRGEDGTASYNLFGIKADRSWRGRVAETATTEYVNGVPQSTRAAFRAYGSYEEAFADYARFLTRNPRYAGVLASGDAAQAAHALQRAGYATDPGYADKLVRIIDRLA